MMHSVRCRFILILFLFLFGTSSCDLVEEVQDDNGKKDEVEVVTQEISENEATAAREFWTKNRMIEAVPIQMNFIIHDGEEPPSLGEVEPVGPNPELQKRDGSPPEISKLFNFYDPDHLRMKAKSDTTVQDASLVNSDYDRYPFSAVGKVFYTKDNNWWACSASVIASENRSVVWTAGHCVAEQGEEDWHERWIFVPAYDDGDTPLGKWAARRKATFTAWYSDGNRNYDLGAVVVERKDERPIAFETGSLGWMFNASRNQDWRELGYPGRGSLFSGQKMWQCFAPYSGADGVNSNPGPRTSAIRDCDMTAGSSGGPWIVSFENCPACYINSAQVGAGGEEGMAI